MCTVTGMATQRSRANRDPYFPFFGSDFYGSEHVRMMTWEERGLYMFLLWHAWVHGSIPKEVEKLAKLFDRDVEWMEARWKALEPCWCEIDGRLHNQRLDEERSNREAYRASQREKGLKGVEARLRSTPSQPGGQPAGQPVGQPTGNPPIPSHPIPYPEGTSLSNGSTVRNGSTLQKGGEIAPLLGEEGKGREGREGFDLLLSIGYRNKSATQSVEILAALRKFTHEGGTDAILRKLAARARRKAKQDPGALLAHWLDRSEWAKEISKR